MTERKSERWSYSVGPYRARVRVFEAANGIIYVEVSGQHRKSLRHRDKDKAVAWAKRVSARLLLGEDEVTDPVPTVARVFAAYLRYATPNKGKKRQKHDHRCAKMWTRVLGARKDLRKLSRREWEAFIRDRKKGAIDSAGMRVPEVKRVPVRDRTIAVDADWLKAVLSWAHAWMDEQGRYLMRENPARGLVTPQEKNPRRPVATESRYRAVRKVSDRITMQVKWGKKRQAIRSYLSEVLDLANATGRRVSAILQLRYEDLRLEQEPHGAIRWPAQTDKEGREWVVPISRAARKAIDRVISERARVGLVTPYLFASPKNPANPVSKDLASTWLRKAEEIAELPKHEGSLWHAYRRKWATERKHLPDADVAAAGGWKDLESLKTAYQQADEATMLEVVTRSRRIRDAK
jgi:hypothetical protein